MRQLEKKDIQQQINKFLEYDCFVGVMVITTDGEEILTDSKWVRDNINFDTYNYIHIDKNSMLLNYSDKGIIEIIAL